jgi:hypothetical protein
MDYLVELCMTNGCIKCLIMDSAGWSSSSPILERKSAMTANLCDVTIQNLLIRR